MSHEGYWDDRLWPGFSMLLWRKGAVTAWACMGRPGFLPWSPLLLTLGSTCSDLGPQMGPGRHLWAAWPNPEEAWCSLGLWWSSFLTQTGSALNAAPFYILQLHWCSTGFIFCCNTPCSVPKSYALRMMHHPVWSFLKLESLIACLFLLELSNMVQWEKEWRSEVSSPRYFPCKLTLST